VFGDFNFERMNETDVRENIIVPLLRELGYRRDSDNDIITEQSLRYPKAFLGRKKSTDPKLRGKADYILEVDRRLRWVIEVKAPTIEIDDDDRDQAWTYAAHPEVKSIFYMVTNGRVFELYRTIDGPGVKPIYHFSYSNVDTQAFHVVSNILGPDALKRDFAAYVLDTGLPLGPGLRSFAKLINGNATYTSCKPSLPGVSLVGLNNHVREGSVERTEDGQIAAFIKFGSSHQQMDQLLAQINLDVFEVSTLEKSISNDPQNPTTFSSLIHTKIPKGTLLFNPGKVDRIAAPFDMNTSTKTTAKGALRNGRFAGSFVLELQISGVPIAMPLVVVEGQFDVAIS